MSTVMKKLAVGESDFKEIIAGSYYYVDKTLLIKDIIDRGDKILLIPRPRRFGKTLNISMLKYFYDCCPMNWIILSESSIWKEIKETMKTAWENCLYS